MKEQIYEWAIKERIHVVTWANYESLEVVISIIGSFDGRLRPDFNSTVKQIPKHLDRITVDLMRTTYIDSAAVAMLLGLKALAETRMTDLVFTYCHSSVRALLKRFCVDELFRIEGPAADQAVYTAKQHGRDRWVQHQTENNR